MSHRLFLGCPIPEASTLDLAEFGRNALASFPVRWSSPEQMHATLLFFGDQENDVCDELVRLTQEIVWRPVAVETDWLRAFGRSAIAAELRASRADMDDLNRRLAGENDPAGTPHPLTKMARLISSNQDGRTHQPFRLHVTLARIKGNLPVSRVPLGGTISFELSRLVLYESHLTPDGAQYEILAEAPALPG